MLLDEAFGLGRDILKRVFSDKTELAKAESALEQMRTNGELQQSIERLKIAQFEAKSADKWTSRARPSFFYVFYTLISFLIIVAPIIGIFQPDMMETFYRNVKLGFEAMPTEMWYTFTAGYLGYGAYRSYEKCKGVCK